MESAWTNLPGEIMELIADKAGDALTGRALSRSVCRSWRAAVPETPRLLLPAAAARGAGGGDEYALVFPLSRGWSVVVDVRDTSCRLSHLATGATAPLPRLNAVRATAGSRVVHLGYEHSAAPAPAPAKTTARRHRKNFRMKRRFHLARGDDWHRPMRRRWEVRMNPAWKRSFRPPDTEHASTGDEQFRIKINFLWYSIFLESDLQFSQFLRFAVHVPANTPPAAASTDDDGMLIMMYHPVQGDTGMVFCRPGDAAWTKLDNPIDDDKHVYNLVDFAYLDGKVFAMDRGGTTAVVDAATLEVLDLVDAPPGTCNVSNKLLGTANGDDTVMSLDYLHLVALPSKLLVVRVRVKKPSSEPESFDVFELGRQDRRDGEGELAWREVAGDDVGGNYDLFLDDHHATFGGGGGDSGSRIYYVHDGKEAYCYSKRDGELKCVYSSPEGSEEQCSTMPSWFVP